MWGRRDKDETRRVETERSVTATYSQRCDMKKLLEAAFAGYPAAMPLTQLAKITGYRKKQLLTFTSERFIGRKLTVAKHNGEDCVATTAVIDFFSSNYGFGIPDRKKSKWHKNLIKELDKRA
ncbi:MAG: hypothetical protein IKD45_00805 [Clostridia bacterium]|nr:hypothetical protein [Clostridia bacterium]